MARKFKLKLATKARMSNKKLEIWIDGYEANVPQRVGSSQVAFELLKHLEKIDHKNRYTILLPSAPLVDLPKERDGWSYRLLRPKKLWTRLALPLALLTARHKPDVVFSPTHYIPRFSRVKRVVTIFDLAYLKFPQMFLKKDLWQLTHWSKYSIIQSDRIITISQSAKKDLLENYPIKASKVVVAHPGYDRQVFYPRVDQTKIAGILKKYQIEGKYIIFLSTLQPRKNHLRLINVLARIEELKLVVVGKTTGLGRQAWMFEDILARPKQLGIADRVIFTGFVPTEDLPYLFCGALAAVQPSLYEGFGMTILEAMACGCPVVASNISSLPEVVGKAGLLVDPYSEDQIEQAIRLITTDKKIRTACSKAALVQASKFSWDKMARAVLSVLEDVANILK